jgi:phospholipid transport system transporter-binding protein
MSDAADNMQSLTSLTVLNATAALERGLAAIRAGQREFDLRHVLTVDSVAVSVMLSWQRAAQEAGLQLELKNLPPALQSLTKLYGVCSLVFPASVQLDPTPSLAANPAHAEFAPVADTVQAAKASLDSAAAAGQPHHH